MEIDHEALLDVNRMVHQENATRVIPGAPLVALTTTIGTEGITMIMRVAINGGKAEISRPPARGHQDIDRQRRVVTNRTTKMILNVLDEKGIPSLNTHPLHLQNGTDLLALPVSKSRPSIDITKKAAGIDLATKSRLHVALLYEYPPRLSPLNNVELGLQTRISRPDALLLLLHQNPYHGMIALTLVLHRRRREDERPLRIMHKHPQVCLLQKITRELPLVDPQEKRKTGILR